MTAQTQGFDLLRTRIASFLQATLPSLIDSVVPTWGLAAWQLPHPQTYDAVDPFKVDKYPAVCIDAADDNDWQITNHFRDGGLEYRVVYGVRLGVVVATPRDDKGVLEDPPYDSAILLRDRLTALVQSLLMENPGMANPTSIQLLTETLNTAYLGSIRPNTQNYTYVAATLLSFRVAQTMTTYSQKIGNANTVNLTGQILTP